MRKKLPLLIGCAVLLLALGIAVAFNVSHTMTSQAESEVLASMAQAVEQTAINIEDRMRSVAALSQMITSDSRLQKSVWRNPSDETINNQLKEIKDLRELVTIAMGRGDVSLVRLYISNTKMLSRERVNFYPVSEIHALPEYKKDHWSSYWYQNHPVETLGFSGDTLSFCQAVRGKGIEYFDQVCAFLIIDVEAQRFRDVICLLDLPGSSGDNRVFLTDAQGHVMLDDGQPVSGQLTQAIMQAADDAGFLSHNGQELAYIRRPLLESGWTLTASMPRSNLLSDSDMLQTSMLIILAALVLFSALAAAGFALVMYTHAVRKQISSINQSLAQSGHITVKSSADRDIFMLNQSINELLRTAAHATEEAYDARLRERDAVLRALQAQINPHFLYNTLDTINWMAISANAMDVSHMINTLAHYYRMSLSKGQDVIPFSEELSIVKAYLEIQSERFDHEFDVSFQIEDATLDCMIPKLTMQPLVENALLHGLLKRRDMTGALLSISACIREDRLIITVEDNGPGLLDSDGSGGYGLTNVRQRLELFTSGCYQLQIHDLPSGGVQAVIAMQLQPA